MAERRRPPQRHAAFGIGERPNGAPDPAVVEALAAALAPEIARRVAAVVGDELVDAVLERLGGVGVGALGRAPAPTPLTAREVAERLGCSYDFVRDHRHELGVLPVVGARPRLLFDAAAVDAWATARSAAVRSPQAETPTGTGKTRRRGRGRAGTEVELLPVGGRSEAA